MIRNLRIQVFQRFINDVILMSFIYFIVFSLIQETFLYNFKLINSFIKNVKIIYFNLF